MLNSRDAVVVVIDIQEKLVAAIHEREKLIDNTRRLIEGAKVLGIPVVHSEQYPRGLGATVPEIASLLEKPPVEKMTFSCCDSVDFCKVFDEMTRRQVLLAGIETHVCVYQTAVQMIGAGMSVHIVTDAVSSRTPENKALGIAKMKDAGAEITGVEMALFELLQTAENPAFKQISKIVR